MVQRLRMDAPDWTGRDGGQPAHCVTYYHRAPSTTGEPKPFRPPAPGHDPWFERPDDALEICNGYGDQARVCPRRQDCLDFALANNESFGVWGGMVEEERRWMRLNLPSSDWGWYPPGTFPPVPADGDEVIVYDLEVDEFIDGEMTVVRCV